MLGTEQTILPQNRVNLEEDEIPTQYYNIQADLREPLPPPLDPKTKQPVNPTSLERIFAKELIRQEISSERYINIPDEVLQAYLEIGRPTPLVRATRLERFLKTPAKIFYKAEYLSPTGSHKPNTAIAQAYYNKKQGTERLATETGAGQWGSALALGSEMFGLKCKVYMVRVSYQQKPGRRVMMETYGAEVRPSPSEDTNFGRSLLVQDKNHPGLLASR